MKLSTEDQLKNCDQVCVQVSLLHAPEDKDDGVVEGDTLRHSKYVSCGCSLFYEMFVCVLILFLSCMHGHAYTLSHN